MKIQTLFAVLIFMTAQITSAQDTSSNVFGKGIKIIARDSSFSMRFGARIQTLMEMEAPSKGKINFYKDVETQFMIRRSRLKLDGFAYSPKLQYKLELGLSSRDLSGANDFTAHSPLLILDAVLKWNFYENFSLWIGQTKLPGNRERVISSQQLQFVDRSLVNSRFNIDRDAGFQLHHHFNINGIVIREAAAISMGEGRDVVADNQGGLDYTARMEVLPLGSFTKGGDYFGSDLAREESPKVSFGATYDFNDNAKRERGQLGRIMEEEKDLESIMLDLMFKYRGFSFMGEYIKKTSPDSPVILDEEGLQTGSFYTGFGYNIQGGYLFENNVEISGRYSFVNPEDLTLRPNQEQFTLGLSRYVVGHNLKVQTDLSYTLLDKTNPELMYRFQVEMAF